MTTQRIRLSAVAAILAAAAWTTTVAVRGQESGTLLSQTLTAQRVGTDPAFDFDVASPKSANTTTKIILEIGPDGNTAVPPPDPSLPNTVKFRISKSGGGTKDFTPAGGTDNATFPSKIVVLNKGLENPGDPRGLYALGIAHLGNGVTATESWKVQIIGLPSAFRVVASIDQGTFKTLTPNGATAAGCPNGQSCQPPCLGACKPGESCQGPCAHIDWSRFRYYEVIQWPIPPPPCLSCPIQWQKPVLDGFDRALIVVTPTNQNGELLGTGRAREVAMNFNGGERVGDLVDGGTGEYLQLVDFRKGSPPSVSVTAAGVTTKTQVVGAGRAGGYGTLEYLIGTVLALISAIIGYVARGMRGDANLTRG
jgi:hypothetical protein